MRLRVDGSLHPAALLLLPIQPHVTCHRCGAVLTGKLRKETTDDRGRPAPACLVGCEPLLHQPGIFD